MEQNVTYRRPAGCGGQIISRDHTYLTDGKTIITVFIIIIIFIIIINIVILMAIVNRDHTYLTDGKTIITVIIIINKCSLYGYYQPRPHLPNNWEMIFCKHGFKRIEYSC